MRIYNLCNQPMTIRFSCALR